MAAEKEDSLSIIHSQVEGRLAFGDFVDHSQRGVADRVLGLSYLAWNASSELGSNLYLSWQLRPDRELYNRVPDDRLGRVSQARGEIQLLNHYAVGFTQKGSFDLSYGVMSLEQDFGKGLWHSFSMRPIRPDRTLGARSKLILNNKHEVYLYCFKPFNEPGENQSVEQNAYQSGNQSSQPYYGLGLVYSYRFIRSRVELQTTYWNQDSEIESSRVLSTYLHSTLNYVHHLASGSNPVFVQTIADLRTTQRTSGLFSLEDLTEWSFTLRGWYQAYRYSGFRVALSIGKSQLPSLLEPTKKVLYEGDSIELSYFYSFSQNLRFDFFTVQDFRKKKGPEEDRYSGGIEFTDSKSDFSALRYGLRVSINTKGNS